MNTASDDVDLRRAAAARVRPATDSPATAARHTDTRRNIDVVERPAGERHRAGYSAGGLRRRVDDAERRLGRPVRAARQRDANCACRRRRAVNERRSCRSTCRRAQAAAGTTRRDRSPNRARRRSTCSHGWFEAAVQATVPAPLCVNRTTCAAVCARNAAPLLLPRTAVTFCPASSSEACRRHWRECSGRDVERPIGVTAHEIRRRRRKSDDGAVLVDGSSTANALPCSPLVATLTRVFVDVCRSRR